MKRAQSAQTLQLRCCSPCSKPPSTTSVACRCALWLGSNPNCRSKHTQKNGASALHHGNTHVTRTEQNHEFQFYFLWLLMSICKWVTWAGNNLCDQNGSRRNRWLNIRRPVFLITISISYVNYYKGKCSPKTCKCRLGVTGLNTRHFSVNRVRDGGTYLLSVAVFIFAAP